MTESVQPGNSSPASSSEDQLRKLQEEISEYQQSLEKWIEAEAEWSHQRRLFKVMIENSTDLIVLTDPSGKRLWNNPAYARILGYEPEELAETHAFSEIHPEDRAQATAALGEAVRKGTHQQTEYRLRRKSGEWVSLETLFVPIVTPERQVESLVLMSRDISETKTLSEALAVASSQSSVSGVLENLARDFDQILTGAIGNLAIARNLNGPRNAVAVRLNEMDRSLQEARDLVERMVSLSTPKDQARVRVALEPILQEAVASVLRGTMVRAEYTFTRNLPEIEVNIEAFNLIIRNLVTNSLQAMDKGVIRITADVVSPAKLAQNPSIALRPGNYICLIIQDQGHGMSDRILPRAFEPHFTTRKGSQGLGLTTALSTIQRMGGTIQLDSTPSVGTTAYVYLPSVQAAKPAITGTSALPTAIVKKRILLMDDEQMILDIVSRMLVHLGYEVATCPEGAQAIAAFTKAKTTGQPFDVVLMDLVIPDGVGGQDAVHTIRKIDPHAKVIASSGHLEHPAMVDHKKFGFVATLEKPYKLERLQQVIEAVIDSSV